MHYSINSSACMIYQSFQQELFPNFFQVMFARAAYSRPTNSCRTSGAGSTMISPAIRNHTGSCIRCCGLRVCSLDIPSTAKSQKVIKPIISPMVQVVLPMSFLFPFAFTPSRPQSCQKNAVGISFLYFNQPLQRIQTTMKFTAELAEQGESKRPRKCCTTRIWAQRRRRPPLLTCCWSRQSVRPSNCIRRTSHSMPRGWRNVRRRSLVDPHDSSDRILIRLANWIWSTQSKWVEWSINKINSINMIVSAWLYIINYNCRLSRIEHFNCNDSQNLHTIYICIFNVQIQDANIFINQRFCNKFISCHSFSHKYNIVSHRFRHEYIFSHILVINFVTSQIKSQFRFDST